MAQENLSLQGKIQLNHFQLECICSVNNKTLSIQIPNIKRSNVLPGDIVLIHLNPINQWILQNKQPLTGIPFLKFKQYFNPQCLHSLMKNFNIVT